MTVSLAGRGAGAQQRGKGGRVLRREAARNLTGTAGDRRLDDRCTEHLVVEHDRKRTAHIGLCDLGKAGCTGTVEPEGDDRLAALLVEGSAGIGQAVTGEPDAVEHRILLTAFVCDHGYARLALVTEKVEAHLGGRAEKLAQARRVLFAWKLDENAVRTHTLDRRLGDADLVDALADDLKALLNGSVDMGGDPRIRLSDGNRVVALAGDGRSLPPTVVPSPIGFASVCNSVTA